MQENKCTVAQNLTQRLDKMAIDNFGHTFTYGKVFYADLDDEPVTVEELYIKKYINNDVVPLLTKRCLKSIKRHRH